MTNSTVGALHIQDGRLCYAEVAATAEGPSVVSVGQRVLEESRGLAFLATDGEVPSEVLDRVAEVRETLSADRGRVVVPPSAVYSFFVPLPAEVDARERRQHVLQQTALVTGTGMVSDLHVVAMAVRPAPEQDERPYEWVHVVALPDAARTQFRTAFGLEEEDEWAWMVSSEAAAYVPRGDGSDASAPFALLVGGYDTHAEFSLVHEADWHHAQYTEAPDHPDDLAYSLRSFLNSVDVSPAAVGEVATYGPTTAHSSVLEAEMGREAAVLDPFAHLDAAEDPAGEPSAFVPCVGAAWHALEN